MAYCISDLTTARCRLTPVVAEDAPFIFRGMSDPRVTRYFPERARFRSLEEVLEKQMTFYAKHREEQTGLLWVARCDGVEVGVIGLYDYRLSDRCAEIGYWLIPEYWGQRLVTELATAVTAFGFAEWDLHRIEAFVEDENVASLRLLDKLGFIREGYLREREWRDGLPVSVAIYGLLRRDIKNE